MGQMGQAVVWEQAQAAPPSIAKGSHGFVGFLGPLWTVTPNHYLKRRLGFSLGE